MSEFDMLASYFLNNTLVPLIISFVIGIFLLKYLKSVREKFFAWFYKQFYNDYNIRVTRYKKDLFAPLQNFRSLDWNLRNQGLVRILEIRAEHGSNFDYYPKNARVILVDSNPHFKKYLEENKAKFPHLKIEKILQGEGEDLRDIKDGSVDIVITTAVLCSVRNVQQVLSEIQRVLAPGGKYFFMEHVIAVEGSWTRLCQKLSNNIWKMIFDGCHITRDSEKSIRQMEFVEMEFKNVNVDVIPYFKMFIGSHVYGTVKKSL